MPKPSGVRVLKPNLPVGLRLSGFLTLLTVMPKLVLLVPLGISSEITRPVKLHATVVPDSNLQLAVGVTSDGNMTSRNEPLLRLDCWDSTTVYDVVAPFVLLAALTEAAEKSAAVVILIFKSASN